jgi:hypothetical protein
MTIYVGDKSDKLKRLSKILGMLGSAHPGEQSSAATKACELLREMGLTWDQVVGPPVLDYHRITAPNSLCFLASSD